MTINTTVIAVLEPPVLLARHSGPHRYRYSITVPNSYQQSPAQIPGVGSDRSGNELVGLEQHTYTETAGKMTRNDTDRVGAELSAAPLYSPHLNHQSPPSQHHPPPCDNHPGTQPSALTTQRKLQWSTAHMMKGVTISWTIMNCVICQLMLSSDVS